MNVQANLELDLESVATEELEATADIMLRTRILNAYENHRPARIVTLDNGPVSEVVFPYNNKWICYLSIIADHYTFRAVNLKTGYMTLECQNIAEIQVAIDNSWPPSAK